jgi:hypothetical protein
MQLRADFIHHICGCCWSWNAALLGQDGRCKTLDASADGYMRGEAAVAHLLEAFLGAAELDAAKLGDGGALILAGTAVNQDGRSSSLTVRCCITWNFLSVASLVYKQRQPMPAPVLLLSQSIRE